MIAEYRPAKAAYEVVANFQGPFAMHPVMAMALGVPGIGCGCGRRRDSGGSFGVKHAVFPYIVLIALAARKAGRPVKWVEDRVEHLVAATSATNRRDDGVGRVSTTTGIVTALAWDQLEDCGAYLRAPEPATLYRMHGNMTGAYRVRHLAIKQPRRPDQQDAERAGARLWRTAGLFRARAADAEASPSTLGLDPLDVIRRNLVDAVSVPLPGRRRARFGRLSCRARSRAEAGGLAELRARRGRARAAGRLYGIGYAAVVEPSISNMGYITTALSPQQRQAPGPKDGAQAAATVALDPQGGVSVAIDSVPQGQGHRTVTAQVVADVFGLAPAAIRVEAALDTGKDAWSIAAGNYSSRFAAATAGAAHLAAARLREKLAGIAAAQLNQRPEDLRFAGGRVFAAANPEIR